jgi:hypothetical protein
MIRASTKRLSYIDDSQLDTMEDHVYVHEIGEADGSGIDIEYSTFEPYKKWIHGMIRKEEGPI